MQAARLFLTQWLCAALVGLLSLLLGCSSATVHIVSADTAAFQQWLHDGMAADARRPAHLMQSYMRGQWVREHDADDLKLRWLNGREPQLIAMC